MNFCRNIQDSRIESACFSFHVGLLFINFSSFKPDTENNTNFDAVSLLRKHANVDKMQFFKTDTKVIIFDTHNLQTFKGNTLVNEVLLMDFLRHSVILIILFKHHWPENDSRQWH